MHEYPVHRSFGASPAHSGNRANGSLPAHFARKPAASQRGRRAGDASGKKGVEGCGGAAICAHWHERGDSGSHRGSGVRRRRDRGGDCRRRPPGAPEGARGFVGIAFRVQGDLRTYDAFYLRPTNGRADDQVRRNHSAQYISHPDWPWFRFGRNFRRKYESYVDLVPGTWTKVRIEVRRRAGAPLRARHETADADRQRRQERREWQGSGSHSGSMQEPSLTFETSRSPESRTFLARDRHGAAATLTRHCLTRHVTRRFSAQQPPG